MDYSQYTRGEVLMSAKGVHFAYPEKTILEDINFEIKDIANKGQVGSFIGRSGNGKTTMLKMMAGLLKPTSGEIKIGRDQAICKPGDMGLVPQDYYMFTWEKVRSVLSIAASYNPKFKKDPKIIKDAVDAYLVAFELEKHADKYPQQLSGGQKQRVSISLQLLNGSDFLLLDEPFSGLDTLMIDKTTALLTRVADADELKTLIIVSHDLSNSVAISDTVWIISKQGRTDEQGATIVKEIDLIERGLAYQPGIKENPKFHETLREIKSLL